MTEPQRAFDCVGDRALAYVGLGSNVGDRLASLRTAASALHASPRISVLAASAVYETEAHVLPEHPPQADHLNAVLRVCTTLRPLGLLRVLHRLERQAGRETSAPKWSPRALDLDLLAFGDERYSGPPLTLPHPRIAERMFVLKPLSELAPDLRVGADDQTVEELLASTRDRGRINQTPYDLWTGTAKNDERRLL